MESIKKSTSLKTEVEWLAPVPEKKEYDWKQVNKGTQTETYVVWMDCKICKENVPVGLGDRNYKTGTCKHCVDDPDAGLAKCLENMKIKEEKKKLWETQAAEALEEEKASFVELKCIEEDCNSKARFWLLPSTTKNFPYTCFKCQQRIRKEAKKLERLVEVSLSSFTKDDGQGIKDT